MVCILHPLKLRVDQPNFCTKYFCASVLSFGNGHDMFAPVWYGRIVAIIILSTSQYKHVFKILTAGNF